MWDKKRIEIAAKSNSVHQLRFTYEGPLTIKAVKTSCGCTVASLDNKKSVVLKYTAPQFPEHLRILGHRETTDEKKVTVTMSDTTKETLTIHVKLSA